jgi:hypothetical protein
MKLVSEDLCNIENGQIRVWVLKLLHFVQKFVCKQPSQYLMHRRLMDAVCVKLHVLFQYHISIA